jgi:hypothetical protein
MAASMGPTFPAGRTVRTVTVAIVAAPGPVTNSAWKVELTRIIMDLNIHLREARDVRLKIVSYGHLKPASSLAQEAGAVGPPFPPRSPRDWLPSFSGLTWPGTESERGILIGLVPEGPDGPANPGIADYLNGIIVLKNLTAKGGMPFVLFHEICHLFGAVDLEEKGSLMSRMAPRFRLDAFTVSIMRANRDRSFRRNDRPLSPEKTREAVSLYTDRQSLGLGEWELGICLEKLRAMIEPELQVQDRRQVQKAP